MATALKTESLTQHLDHMLARATSVLRHMSDNDTIPKENGERQHFWSALFQAMVADTFGRLSPNIERWQRQYEAIRDYWKVNDPPLASSDDAFHDVVYTSFQFWNARDQRVTAFAVNHDANEPSDEAAVAAVQNEWALRWKVMRETQLAADGHGLIPRSIGNIVVNRLDVRHSNTTIFKFQLGERRNWNNFRFAVPQSDGPLPNGELTAAAVISYVQQCHERSKNALDSFDIPTSVIRSIFFYQPGSVRDAGDRSLYTQLQRSEPDAAVQAGIIQQFVSDESLDRDLWQQPDLATTLKYLAAYIFDNYYQSADEWNLRLDDLKYLIINNLAVCMPVLIDDESIRSGKNRLIVRQYQYCIPVWNSSTSYLFLTTKHKLKNTHLMAYKSFAERLFFICWVIDSKAQLETDKQVQLAQAQRNARTAILARNFSHSIGSHVLMSAGFAAALNPSTEIVKKALDKAQTFLLSVGNSAKQSPIDSSILHKYQTYIEREFEYIKLSQNNRDINRFFLFLQGRFDYIAGAIFDWTYLPNVTAFHRDILKPLLVQTAYLEHFVADLGRSILGIVITVHVRERSGKFTSVNYSFSREDGVLLLNPLTKTEGRDDIMVAMPISNSAKHAFYSLFENFLRNSLKYNTPEAHSSGAYAVHMMWKYNDDSLDFYMWDNLSTDVVTNAVEEMRRILEESLVDEKTLVLRSKGLGIKEMRLSAELLGGVEALPGSRVLRLCEQSEIEQIGLDVPARIVYSFRCKIPIYLALIGTSRQGTYIVSFVSVHSLVARGVRLLALDGKRLAQEPSLLREVLRNRSCLPFRTFILCPTEAHRLQLEARIVEAQGVEGPTRAIPIIVDCAGHEQLKRESVIEDGDMMSDSPEELLRQQSFVIAMYELWLRAWKGVPPRGGRWHLFIALGREAATAGAWERHLVALGEESTHLPSGKWSSQLISVAVSFNDKSLTSGDCSAEMCEALGEPRGAYWQAETAAEIDLKRALVIDNHSRQFDYVASMGNFNCASRCYIALEGAQSPELYQELTDVPHDPFDFAIFVHEMVEAMLFQAVIVDERLELFMQDDQKVVVAFEKSGIFPADLKLILSETSEQETSRNYGKETGRSAGGFGKISKEYCDAVVIHEGLLEVSLERSQLDDKKALTQLSEEDVLVVTTSGRGNRSRFHSHHALFLEASALHASIIASRNKLALFRYVTNSLSMQTVAPGEGGLDRAARSSDR